MTRPFVALAVLLLLAGVSSAVRAQTIADVPINDKTQIFCRDITGTPVLQTFSNLGGVMRRWSDRFHFDMSVEPGNPLKLVFANPQESPYSLTYQVEPYRDPQGRSGILLDSMHLFLDNADRDVTGLAMCYFTEYGK